MNPRYLAILALPALAGCTDDPGFRGVSGVRSITAEQATACTFVVDIRGQPGAYGPFAQQGLEYGRNQVLAMARDSGANAVVFQPVPPGELVTEIRGSAYRC